MSNVGSALTDQSQVAKLEGKRRMRISVDEWLELAAALGVAPLSLVLPREPNAWLRVNDKFFLEGRFAHSWLLGLSPLPDMLAMEDDKLEIWNALALPMPDDSVKERFDFWLDNHGELETRAYRKRGLLELVQCVHAFVDVMADDTADDDERTAQLDYLVSLIDVQRAELEARARARAASRRVEPK